MVAGVECIFCRIVKGEAEAYTVYKGNGVTVFLDRYPASKGHLLVVPDEHYESIHTAPPRVAAKVWLAASAIARYYREKAGAPAVNVLTNSGRYAGQIIFHFHVHVIPRWGPPRSFWGDRHEITPEEAGEVLDMLRGVEKLIEEYLGELNLLQG
ncbi:HIT family protein [Aeropyrum pernix]|uniref:HIT family protein n=1 Tax=Aeropyrum pernix TaxID=56636 RepID=A0A401H9W6_AERPX|nr:HIT family protein [Aeropyrum pernix]